jgi:aspartyl-tRNA(Asn)/glutamyl-tRNA(Gln) amidotransferase subunit B
MYKPVIGLEVHVELSTKSKMFCGCIADHFGKPANTQVCPVCLGLPGALPFPNKQAINWVVKFGSALNCQIAEFSKFDRKNYFYPDLPKGYQISQYDMPFCTNGSWISKDKNKVRIKRIHLEEDTGKLIHSEVNGEKVSLIDYNRSSVPLMELVTEPDFDDPGLVDEFLKEIQLIVKYLGISTADMEKGSMRLEANISMRDESKLVGRIPPNTQSVKVFETRHLLYRDLALPDYKVELKNINSFKFLQKAISAEIERQTQALESGEKLIQETRGYNEATGKTFSQRVKEEANDYRYFPEPDIPPIKFTQEEIDSLKQIDVELPNNKRLRYINDFGLPENYVEILLLDPTRSKYFEKAVESAKNHNVSIKELAGVMVNQNLDEKYPEPEGLVLKLVELQKKEYATREEVEGAVKEALLQNPKALEDYKKGNANVVGFLVGMTQKNLQGRGEPKLIQTILLEQLQK